MKGLYATLAIALLLVFGSIAFTQEGEADSTSTVTLRPDGVGSVTRIRNVEPYHTDHYAAVDEETPDYYTTCVWGFNDSYKYDLYTIGTSSALTGKTITNLKVRMIAKASEMLTPYLRAAIKESGGDLTYGSVSSVGTEWGAYSWQWATKPSGGAWTKAVIDDLEVGISLSCYVSQKFLYVTQMWVEVDYQEPTPEPIPEPPQPPPEASEFVPEPGSALLLLVGVGGLLAFAKRG